jgi:hypothetical protein
MKQIDVRKTASGDIVNSKIQRKVSHYASAGPGIHRQGLFLEGLK